MKRRIATNKGPGRVLLALLCASALAALLPAAHAWLFASPSPPATPVHATPPHSTRTPFPSAPASLEYSPFTLHAGLERHAADGARALALLEVEDAACWARARQALRTGHQDGDSAQSGCERLSYERRARASVQLAVCHVQMSAAPGDDARWDEAADCGAAEPLATCLRRVGADERMFATYTAFFTSIDSICLYMAQQHFREATTVAISRLYESAIDVGEQLRDFSASSEQLDDMLRSSILLQQQQGAAMESLAESERARFEHIERKGEAILLAQQSIGEGQAALLEDVNQIQLVHSALQKELQATLEDMESHHASMFERVIEGEQDLLRGQERAAALLVDLVSKQVEVEAMVAATQSHLAQLKHQQAEAFGEAQLHIARLVELSEDAQRTFDVVLDRLARILDLDTTIFAHVFGMSTFLYYALAFFGALLASSASRTSAARLPVFGLLLGNLLAERWILASGSAGGGVAEASGLVSVVRRLVLCVGVAMVVWAWRTAKEYGRLNHALLLEMRVRRRPRRAAQLAR